MFVISKIDLGVIELFFLSFSFMKKGSLINWFFLDKIKFLRIVRKFFMKMKRLLEFSRKLSVKGILNYVYGVDSVFFLFKCNC